MKVLVVEDNEQRGLALKEALEKDGFDVMVVFNGADGLRAIRDNGFGFVISDENLSDMDGLELLSKSPGIPFLVYTFGDNIEGFGKLVRRLGGLDFIPNATLKSIHDGAVAWLNRLCDKNINLTNKFLEA